MVINTMDKNSNNKQIQPRIKLNYFDFLIFFLFIIAVLSIIFHTRIEKGINNYVSGSYAKVYFMTEKIDSNDLSNVAQDSEIKVNSDSIGIIKAVSIDYAKEFIVDSKNLSSSMYNVYGYEFVEVKDKNYYVASGELLSNGSIKDDGFYLNGNERIAVGMVYSVTIGNNAYKITITGIEY